MKKLDIISAFLLLIGGLTWGLIGFFDFNLIEAIVGMGVFANLIYILVGLAALYRIFLWKAIVKRCK